MLQLKHFIFGLSLTVGCMVIVVFDNGECGFLSLLYPGPSRLRLPASCVVLLLGLLRDLLLLLDAALPPFALHEVRVLGRWASDLVV